MLKQQQQKSKQKKQKIQKIFYLEKNNARQACYSCVMPPLCPINAIIY